MVYFRIIIIASKRLMNLAANLYLWSCSDIGFASSILHCSPVHILVVDMLLVCDL